MGRSKVKFYTLISNICGYSIRCMANGKSAAFILNNQEQFSTSDELLLLEESAIDLDINI